MSEVRSTFFKRGVIEFWGWGRSQNFFQQQSSYLDSVRIRNRLFYEGLSSREAHAGFGKEVKLFWEHHKWQCGYNQPRYSSR